MEKIYNLSAVILLILLLPICSFAQNPPAYALENVTIHHSDGSVIESGTIVWRDGVIEAVGSNPEIPYDAFTIDGGDSLHVYPGFIDGLGTWGSPDLPRNPEEPNDPGNPGYERAGIQPDRSAGEHLDASGKTISEVMKTGITTANLGLKGYMLAGQPDLYFLNGEDTPDHLFKKSKGFQFSFEGAPGGWSSRAYPSTTMGVMARFRQLMYDAEALQDHIQYFAAADDAIQAPKRDKVLESLFPLLNQEKTVLAKVDSPENIERLMLLKEEFGFDVIIVSGKSSHYKAKTLADLEIPVLASFELTEKPDWMKKDDEGEEESEDEKSEEPEEISEEESYYRQRQQEAYNAAVQNIRTLIDAGVQVGFASAGLSADDIHKHILRLKEEGDLTETEILQILTANTAEILNERSVLGGLESGKIAGFSVFNSPFFDEEPTVKMVISNGVIHEF